MKKKFLLYGVLGILILYPMMTEAIIAEYIRENITPVEVIDEFNNQFNLVRPADVYVDVIGNLYVVDSYHHTVFMFDDHYQSITRLDSTNGVIAPVAVAADKRGNIYVSDAKKGVLVFNSIGKIIKKIDISKFTEGEVKYPVDLLVDKSDNIYLVTGTEQGGVLVLDKKGKVKGRIIPKDSVKEGEPPIPICITRIALDAENKIYLISQDMGKIYVYKDFETFSFGFGQKGGSLGKLSRPVGLSVDCSKGLIYVLDYMRHTISIYNLKGAFLQEYGGNGSAVGWFDYPRQICLDKKQQLVIADTFNGRIQILAVNSR